MRERRIAILWQVFRASRNFLRRDARKTTMPLKSLKSKGTSGSTGTKNGVPNYRIEHEGYEVAVSIRSLMKSGRRGTQLKAIGWERR